MRKPGGQRFLDGLKKMYFDTVLYSEGGLKLLIDLVGPERCLFGAECPGVGSAINPDTGTTFDNIRPIIESFDWLTPEQKKMIFEDNARRVFNLPA
jgi:predicted TIM-barrel fold metal-dependent hydrolase